MELDAHPEDVEEDDQEDGGEMEVAAAIGFEQRDGAKRAGRRTHRTPKAFTLFQF